MALAKASRLSNVARHASRRPRKASQLSYTSLLPCTNCTKEGKKSCARVWRPLSPVWLCGVDDPVFGVELVFVFFSFSFLQSVCACAGGLTLCGPMHPFHYAWLWWWYVRVTHVRNHALDKMGKNEKKKYIHERAKHGSEERALLTRRESFVVFLLSRGVVRGFSNVQRGASRQATNPLERYSTRHDAACVSSFWHLNVLLWGSAFFSSLRLALSVLYFAHICTNVKLCSKSTHSLVPVCVCVW